MATGKRYNLEDWKNICTEKHNGKYTYEKVTEYINKKQVMEIYCTEHNCFFKQRADSHIRGYAGCPECKHQKAKKSAFKPLSYAQEKIEEAIKGKNIEIDYSTYKGMGEQITAYCHNVDDKGVEHGVFYPKIENLVNGHGCKKCGFERAANFHRTDFNEFMEKMKVIHPKLDFSLVKPFKNVDETIYVICHEKDEFGEEHGVYPTTPHRLLNGNKCKKCLHLEKISLDIWKKRCAKKHQNKYIYDEVHFNNLNDVVNIICKKHGMFQQTARNHLYGHGCSICSNSQLEDRVSICLNENNIEYLTNDRKILSGLELDFYLPLLNIGIECQGEQHFIMKTFGGKDEEKNLKRFAEQQERDNRKKQLCQEKGIELIYFLDKEYNSFMTETDIYFNKFENLLNYIKNKSNGNTFQRNC